MKVTVIGGGSTYTPELINGFIEKIDSFPLDELWLMDIDPERLTVVGEFVQRILHAKNDLFKVILSSDQREAIRGASYVITQFRVGKMQARREDEYLGKRHGLIGQETTGIGGMAKALRTIPVVLNIAKDIAEVAPQALLINFTNPSGLITEALFRYAPEVQKVGVCNAAINFKMEVLKEWERISGESYTLQQTFLDTLGLNHLSWHRGFKVGGKDIWPQIIQNYLQKPKAEFKSDDLVWNSKLIQSLNMIPNYYLEYYYQTDQKLAAQDQWPPSRAEEVLVVEKELLDEYADPNNFSIPKNIMLRGGAYYSTLATKVVNSHYQNLGEIHEVNVPHRGAVRGYPNEWVLEMPCKIDRSGIHPLPAEPLPAACYGLLAAVKAYEELTVEAAVHGNYDAAYQALLVHPLGPSADKIEEVLDDLLLTNKDFLQRFNK